MKTMKKDHLTNWLLQHCHKSITDMLNTADIAKKVCLQKQTMQDISENTSRESRKSAWLNDEPPHISKWFTTSEGSFHHIKNQYLKENQLFKCGTDGAE